jgi:hypothetical protein
VSVVDLGSLLGVRVIDIIKFILRLGEDLKSSKEILSTDLVNLICEEHKVRPVRVYSKQSDHTLQKVVIGISNCKRSSRKN